jgi:hypothetical protein
MFGQLCFPGEVDFGVVDLGAGEGVLGVVEVDAAGVADPLSVATPEPLLVLGDAAPAMPAAAPPVASAPATIVAPSILETCISNLLGSMDFSASIVESQAKRMCTRV